MSTPEQDQTPVEFQLKPDLLDRINRALKELGSTATYRRVPEYQPGYEHLKDKKVLIVDDVFAVLEEFLPELMTASNGNADFIHYKGQTLDELTAQILEKIPDLLFLDYHLSDSLKGSAVAKRLKEQGFGGDVIGFSSDRETASDFMKSGVRGTLDKYVHNFSDQLVESGAMFEPKNPPAGKQE